jgi:hypothetical protein
MDEEKSIYEYVAERRERSGWPCARAGNCAGKRGVDQAGNSILVRNLARRSQIQATPVRIL